MVSNKTIATIIFIIFGIFIISIALIDNEASVNSGYNLKVSITNKEHLSEIKISRSYYYPLYLLKVKHNETYYYLNVNKQTYDKLNINDIILLQNIKMFETKQCKRTPIGLY